MDLRIGCVEPIEHPGGGGCRIDLYARACRREIVECGSQLLGRCDGDLVAEMAIETRSELAPVDKQRDDPVLPEDRKGQR